MDAYAYSLTKIYIFYNRAKQYKYIIVANNIMLIYRPSVLDHE